MASQAQHQLQVLHGRAAGTFAQVVQARHQHGLAVSGIAKHANFQPVGVVQCQGIQLAGLRGGEHADHAAVRRTGCVVRQQGLVQADRWGTDATGRVTLQAAQTLKKAFRTDVSPILAMARLRSGGAVDPVAAYRASGYREQVAVKRPPKAGASGSGIV